MKHTKEPWNVKYEMERGEYTTYTLNDFLHTEDEAQANAQLIASAPELLEALELIAKGIDSDGIILGSSGSIDIAIKAIKKAKGEK